MRHLFIAPQAGEQPNYGIGWWREADDKRVWYFGTQSPESTIGHQGWTGKLIDKAKEDTGKSLSEEHPLKLALKALQEASEDFQQ
ncbi:hypothetical protein [Butyrivibrio sp. AC2005]|uniref:hypothetical protein n=1 Tax=Butyrivibrio sp. AC2005 TaxID=1280672 RepID=UPI000428EABC|nr:hypothetical protein [Butyrivibrio sp. AC2005]